MSASTFAAVAVSVYAAHQVGDYWVQTSDQAAKKGLPGWEGANACLMHVGSYSGTLLAFLGVTIWWLSLPASPLWLVGGVLFNAVTHYFADRRRPLAWVARRLGKSGFWNAGDRLATGAALLDQAWHWGWLFVSALVISGPPS